MLTEYHINKGLKNGESYLIDTVKTRQEAETIIKDLEKENTKYVYTIIEEKYDPEKIIKAANKFKAVITYFSFKFNIILFLIAIIIIAFWKVYILWINLKNS